MCEVCLVTVQHYLGIDDVGVCDAFLTWTSGLSRACSEVDPRAAQCPDLPNTEGCGELLGWNAESWGTGLPPIRLQLSTLTAACTSCMAALGRVDLSSCPREKQFHQSVNGLCLSYTNTQCFSNAITANQQVYASCQQAVALWSQVGVVATVRQTSDVCGNCLPVLRDTLGNWTLDGCPGADSQKITEMRLQCAGSSEQDCVASFAVALPGCELLAAWLLGAGVSISTPDCLNCIDNLGTAWAARVANNDSIVFGCPNFEETRADLRSRCERGAFQSVRCADLFKWLVGNQTFAREQTRTAVPTATLPLDATPQPPPVPTPRPFTDWSSTKDDAGLRDDVQDDPTLGASCNNPQTCECVEEIPAYFARDWYYHLPGCGLNVEQRTTECRCNRIKAEFYADVPECSTEACRTAGADPVDCKGLLERDYQQDYFDELCAGCARHLNRTASTGRRHTQEYDLCTNGNQAESLRIGVFSACSPGGLARKLECPGTLMQAARDLKHCQGTFEAVINATVHGVTLGGDQFLDLMCKNGTLCSDSLVNHQEIWSVLDTQCGFKIATDAQACKCWRHRTDFLDPARAKDCYVLDDFLWRSSDIQFLRLCKNCLPQMTVHAAFLQAYATCSGRRPDYAADLIGHYQSICDQGYLGANGYTPAPVVSSACQLSQDGSAGCLPQEWCALELNHTQECAVIGSNPDWRTGATSEAARIQGCLQCIKPLVCTAYELSNCTRTSGSPEDARRSLQRLEACDEHYKVELLAHTCQHVAGFGICGMLPHLCNATVDRGNCTGDALLEAERQWVGFARCARHNKGSNQCRCAASYLELAPDECQSGQNQGHLGWECAVRRLGCTQVRYPTDANSAECAAQAAVVGWSTLHLDSSWTVCPESNLQTYYSSLAACSPTVKNESTFTQICACRKIPWNNLPERCHWDEPGTYLRYMGCVQQRVYKCRAGACCGLFNSVTSSEGCDASADSLDQVPMPAPQEWEVDCFQQTARVAGQAMAEFEICASRSDGSKGAVCLCLEDAHDWMRFMPQCSRSWPQWEALRCVAAQLGCSTSDGGSAPARPYRTWMCQYTLGLPSATPLGLPVSPSRVKNGLVVAGGGVNAVLTPYCHWNMYSQLEAIFRNCMKRLPDIGWRCGCLTEFAARIPVACRQSPTAAWTHIQCLASDMGCTSIPALSVHDCSKFYPLWANEPPPEVTSVVDVVGTRLATELNSIPTDCKDPEAAMRAFETCRTHLVSNLNRPDRPEAPGMAGASWTAGQHRAAYLQAAQCDCIAMAHIALAACDAFQPTLLESLRCEAEQWHCHTLPSHVDLFASVPLPVSACAAATTSPRSRPAHAVCAGVYHELRRRDDTLAAEVSGTPASLTRRCHAHTLFLASVPSPCRADGVTSTDYNLGLCEAVLDDCPVAELPTVDCRYIYASPLPPVPGNFSAPGGLFSSAGRQRVFAGKRCRDLLLAVSSEPTCDPVWEGSYPWNLSTQAQTAALCNSTCQQLITLHRRELLTFCSGGDWDRVSWLSALCVSRPGPPVDYCFPHLVAFEKAVQSRARVSPSLPGDPAKNRFALRARQEWLGTWSGPKGSALASLRQATNLHTQNSLNHRCSPCLLRILSVLHGHREVASIQAVCSLKGDAREGYNLPVYCGSSDRAWDWSTDGGVRAMCSDRCWRRTNAHEADSETDPAARARRIDTAHTACITDESNNYCLERVLDRGFGPAGSDDPWSEPLYPQENCTEPLADFRECARGGNVPLCQCVDALAQARPQMECLAHHNVAPGTLCLLSPEDDLCVTTTYATQHARYCSSRLAEESACLELLWNDKMECTPYCAQVFQRYFYDWGCCSATYERFLQGFTEGSYSYKHIRESCGITVPQECTPRLSDLMVEGRLVLRMSWSVVNRSVALYTEDATEDGLTALGLHRRNLRAVYVGPATQVTTLGERRAEVEQASTDVEVRWLISGDNDNDTVQLRRDVVMMLDNGFVMPRVARRYAQDTADPLVVNTYLASVSAIQNTSDLLPPAPVASPAELHPSAGRAVLPAIAVAVALAAAVLSQA
eukprot:TRINITY_DN26462_c0_g1_i2.p1 TRINITY_DN26462_c0_g1~~TRINITY_DN26462_c0_g1_i2.p1  ORF type:complete len:2045 (+),score=510.55 TRINITY_DN26462_c0_g1_i2:430-6564(+)